MTIFIENEKETEFEYSLKNIEVKFIHLIYSKENWINQIIYNPEFKELINLYKRPFFFKSQDSYKDVEIIDTGSDLLSIKPKLKENLTMSKKALNDIYNQENTPKYQSIKSKIQDRKNK